MWMWFSKEQWPKYTNYDEKVALEEKKEFCNGKSGRNENDPGWKLVRVEISKREKEEILSDVTKAANICDSIKQVD